MKKFYWICLAILVLFFLGCSMNSMNETTTEEGNLESGGNLSRAAGEVNSVLTCYWVTDPDPECAEMDDFWPCRCVQPLYTGEIDWEANPPKLKSMSHIMNNGNEVWVNGKMFERYEMEGTGIVYGDGNEEDFIVQLQGHFLFKDPDPNSSEYREFPIFNKIKRSSCKWGEGYWRPYVGGANPHFDDNHGVETKLIPWKHVAVSDNIKPNTNVTIPVLKNKTLYNPENGETVKINGVFKAIDTSWSFNYRDLTLPKNDGVETWVDVFVGLYDGYWDNTPDNSGNNVEDILNKAGTSVAWHKRMYKGNWNNQTGAWKGTYKPASADDDQWVTKIKATLQTIDLKAYIERGKHNERGFYGERYGYNKYYTSGDLVIYNGAVYKCKWYEFSQPGREPDKAYMWAVWTKLGNYGLHPHVHY